MGVCCTAPDVAPGHLPRISEEQRGELKVSILSTHKSSQPHISYWPPVSIIALSIQLVLVAAGAVQGGIAMVTDPESPMGMSLRHLEATPFDNFMWPGLFLIGIAASSIVTIPGLLLRWEWDWAWRIESAVGYEWPWISVMAIGVLLFSFEIIGLLFGQLPFVIHLLLLALSLNMIGLALTDSARRYLAS